jgi:hypothetical protein
MLSLDTNKQLLEQANVYLKQLSDDKLKFAITLFYQSWKTVTLFKR